MQSKVIKGKLHVDQGVVAGCCAGSFSNIYAMSQIAKNMDRGLGTFGLNIYPASQPIMVALTKAGAITTLMEYGARIKSAFCGPCFGCPAFSKEVYEKCMVEKYSVHTTLQKLFRQNFNPILFYKHHIFDLRGEAVVDGIRGPSVVLIHKEIRTSLIDHGLNGKHHARNKEHLASPGGDIAHEGIFVEGKTDPVPADLLHDGITVCPGVCVDGVGNISQMAPRFCGGRVWFWRWFWFSVRARAGFCGGAGLCRNRFQ